jgi:hypothetical protein
MKIQDSRFKIQNVNIFVFCLLILLLFVGTVFASTEPSVAVAASIKKVEQLNSEG